MKNFALKSAISVMRSIMVPISFGLLITNYVVAAIVQGFFLTLLAPSLPFYISYAIGFCIQLTRGALVFFPVMDRERPVTGYAGEIVAAVMCAAAVYEIIHINGHTNVSSALSLTLSLLMIMGFMVEFYLLRTVKASLINDFFKNPKNATNIMKASANKANYKVFMARLREQEQSILDTIGEEAEGNEQAPVKAKELHYQEIIPNGTKAVVGH